ncbi:MAG: biotin/lipoyl-binding protein [Acidobacteria bacterium]|uniref:Biotin/lipoyl-binding protein n=1 Tax=Candidatus Polarisedimenticola svalbardensis TaxID=2886004 RepID=A0A8J6Y104_9BACT|nr:biotin/lipoyl-binding protein [Candidatus Polarisedimenticola svalbardensis]
MKITARVGDAVQEVNIERRDKDFLVEIDGESRLVNADKLEGDFYSILSGGKSYEVSVEVAGDGYIIRHGASEQQVRFTDASRQAREMSGAKEGPQTVESMMPGKVVRVLVKAGDRVTEGQGLVVVEAMKMENEIESPKDGKVTEVKVEPGQAVESGGALVVVE